METAEFPLTEAPVKVRKVGTLKRVKSQLETLASGQSIRLEGVSIGNQQFLRKQLAGVAVVTVQGGVIIVTKS